MVELIPAEEVFKKYHDDPKYQEAYKELDAEFELLEEMIKLRTRSKLTQEELAERIGTKQSAIARIEGGQLPSTKTLQKIAAATGTRLKISFVPLEDGAQV